MRNFRKIALAGVAAALLAGVLTAPSAADASTTTHAVRACSASVPRGYAACFALVRTSGARPATAKTPSGYGPSDIRSAYNLAGASSGGKTVAIVDAFNDPHAAADLATYRSTYGLPPCKPTGGCFKKVDQTGGTNYPRNNAGWTLEMSLDLDMVSATCPDCHILLVEANNASLANLGAAVDYAASRAGVVAISNSYGGSDIHQTADYNHPGIAITASTGDSGYGVSSPASFRTVIAVGGTSLVHTGGGGRGWTETAWNGAGSGCSKNPKPAWQTAATQCSHKANADVSAVADPNTGVAVYDSVPYQGSSGWFVVGGTSASSPLIASVYAMSANLPKYPASYTWAHSSGLYDVTVGSNGVCSPLVWCTAGAGWDGPTGLGTPNGTGSF